MNLNLNDHNPLGILFFNGVQAVNCFLQYFSNHVVLITQAVELAVMSKFLSNFVVFFSHPEISEPAAFPQNWNNTDSLKPGIISFPQMALGLFSHLPWGQWPVEQNKRSVSGATNWVSSRSLFCCFCCYLFFFSNCHILQTVIFFKCLENI